MIQIDMEMPKTCEDCPFHVYHSGGQYVCKATPLLYPMNLANYKDGRKDFCPLKEVPSGEWIPTSETMPDNPSEDVLVCDIDGDIYKAYLSDYDGWKRSEDFEKVKNVVAWQPLPPAYKMESEDRK